MVDERKLMKPFKDNLQELMNKSGETVSSLAKATGIPKSTISEWCAGRKPMLDGAILKLAHHFGVSVEKLISGVEPEENLADGLLEHLEEGFVTLHSGVYRLKLEKFTGKKKGGGK